MAKDIFRFGLLIIFLIIVGAALIGPALTGLTPLDTVSFASPTHEVIDSGIKGLSTKYFNISTADETKLKTEDIDLAREAWAGVEDRRKAESEAWISLINTAKILLIFIVISSIFLSVYWVHKTSKI